MVSGRVSKLYNTLEKIRTGEQGGFSQKKSAPAKGFGQNTNTSRMRLLVLLGAFAMLALVVFFTWPTHKNTKTPTTANTVAPMQSAGHPAGSAPLADSPTTPPPAFPPGSGANLYQQLNDRGIALIQENQPWRGMYYLDQAHKQQPERPEALINMAVALAELGLRAPAKRLFSQAHALAPNHPQLRKNLELLEQAGFFEPQWLSSLSAGQTQSEQTTQPR